MNEWGLFTLWMLRSCCAKFDFLFKAVLTSKQQHWRTGWVWLLWRWGTSRGWLWTDGIMWDRYMESAARSRAFLSQEAHHFTEGYNIRYSQSHARFTQIWLRFICSAFVIFSSVPEHEISWCLCSKTMNSPQLLLFSRQAAGQPYSLPPSNTPLPFDHRLQVAVCLWSRAAPANKNVSTPLTVVKKCGCLAPA